MIPLYDNIKKLRIQSKLSQQQLAELTGYTDRSSIAKIEKGIIELSESKISLFAKALNVSEAYLMGWESDNKIIEDTPKGFKVPVLGEVAAGTPIEAVEDIIDYEELPIAWKSKGEFFGLQIKGNSMQPKMDEGDVVIVKQQSDAETGDTIIAIVNGDNATCKKLKKTDNGLMLISTNPEYEPMFYTWQEVKEKPVTIIGKVVELRAKF